jgi:hypothetical protein
MRFWLEPDSIALLFVLAVLDPSEGGTLPSPFWWVGPLLLNPPQAMRFA